MTLPLFLYSLSSREGHIEVCFISSIFRNKLVLNGDHSVLIRAPPPSNTFLGFVSDKSLLDWFTTSAQKSLSLGAYVSTPLSNLALPSLYLYTSVVATKASDTVLDAMRLMSDYGVSSVAVIEEEGGGLLSAVSVTDIGKVDFSVTSIMKTHSRFVDCGSVPE